MWRKFVLYLFHENKICEKICNKKYPWSWKSKKLINNYKNMLTENTNEYIKINQMAKKNLNDFNQDIFVNSSIFAYNIIYKSYIDKVDFLDYQYTNPKLSIALNQIRNDTSEDLILNLPKKINVNNSTILSNVLKNEFTSDNFKMFGFYNNNEILQELVSGAIGPEVSHLWDQRPIKQVVNVLYESDEYCDILEWERDLSEEDPQWHVSNINILI